MAWLAGKVQGVVVQITDETRRLTIRKFGDTKDLIAAARTHFSERSFKRKL